jgi:hypothetical protein
MADPTVDRVLFTYAVDPLPLNGVVIIGKDCAPVSNELLAEIGQNRANWLCQSALNFDPGSASNIDPGGGSSTESTGGTCAS